MICQPFRSEGATYRIVRASPSEVVGSGVVVQKQMSGVWADIGEPFATVEAAMKFIKGKGADKMKEYTRDSPVSEAVEIRLFNERLMVPGECWVLIAEVSVAGTIRACLTRNGAGTLNGLSTIQSKLTFPNKAVPGWQKEMVEAAGSGIYRIIEVR